MESEENASINSSRSFNRKRQKRIKPEDVFEQKQHMHQRLRDFREELQSIRMLNTGRDELLERGIEELKVDMKDLQRQISRLSSLYESF